MSGAVCPIVGIGASAGGLAALQALFQALPPDTGAAFVVIQHLDPKHESLTAEILTRSTSMQSVQINNGMVAEPNHVYVIPPNAYLTLQGHTFELGEPVLRHGLRMPIDTFLQSLAEQLEEHAIAIIVSGTGSDGTLGVRAVKGNGGLVLAQATETAQYDGMPRSTIATGLVDFVCPVEEMSGHLEHYLRHPYIREPVAPENGSETRQLSAILGLLKTRCGRDFSAYKQGTMLRRIARRMGLHHIETIAEYLVFLRNQEDEATLLFKDLLIGVTAFFRDSEAFEALDEKFIVPLVEKKHTGEPIRVWVPGCASGEEAYSIAMLLIERLDAAHKQCPIQVFATDIDEFALEVGRAGIYPENIAADLSPARLNRFFTREDHSYRVSKSLREILTFASQDLIGDPPFSNMDLISCRNLLIYFKPEIQPKVFALFHFALRTDGGLFLGHSETVNHLDGLFEPLAKQRRIYRRNDVTSAPSIGFPIVSTRPRTLTEQTRTPARSSEQVRLGELAQRYLLQEYAPAAIVVNRQHQVLYFSGPTMRYLAQPTGTPTQDLWSLVRPELRSKLRVALHQSADKSSPVALDDAHAMRGAERVRVKVSLTPLPRLSESLTLITFEDLTEPAAPAGVNKRPIAGTDTLLVEHIENDLSAMREELQDNAEEQESAHEELQASNEEVMSVNEELQSTNEELETSKEELQSMNEELTTVNSQLKEKLDELAHSNNDLSNLMVSTDIATLFLDTQLTIRRFTPAIKHLFNLISSDIGRPLRDIRQIFTGGDILADAQKVLDKLTPLKGEVYTESGDYYICHVLPYRTSDNHISGVVITFVDITERKSALEQAERLASIVRDSNDAITLQDLQGKIIAWNYGAVHMYGWSEQEALKMNMGNLAPEVEQKTMQDLIRRIIAGERVGQFDSQRLTKSMRLLEVSLTVTAVKDDSGHIIAIATTERDVTEHNLMVNELRESEANFRALVDSAPDAMLVADATGTLTMVNRQAEHLFGYTKDELLDTTVENLMPERYRASHVTKLRGFMAAQGVPEGGWGPDIYALTKGGKEIPIEVSLSPITTHQGSVVVASVRDISARKHVEEAIAAKALIEVAYATKSRFLATASHDLRQPLQSLTLLNAALLKTVDDPNAQKMLIKQHESLDGMGRLLNSLLDISKLESGTVTAAHEVVPLQPLFEHLSADFGAEADEKGLQLELDVGDISVHTDPDLLSQLLHNLLANAIRYTKQGYVRLSCVAVNDQVRIEVSDSGVGISAAQLTHIFDEFHQVDRDPQQRHGGLGLGLSIVERIAALLGTRVAVQSEVGRGSTFSITLAAAEAKPAQAVTPEVLSAQTGVHKGVILLIDDDPGVLDASQMFLELEEEFEITTATSPPEAYAVLKDLKPDLIITDFHLGHQDTGIDIVRVAREHAGQTIPAILISGDTGASIGEIDIENVRFFSKPLDAKELVRVAHQLLQASTV